MKTKLKSITIIMILLAIVTSILTYPKDTIDSVLTAVNIWAYNVFPSLFPFFILSNLLLNYGFVEFLSELFTNVMSYFGLSGNCSFPLLGSIISGFPSGPKYIKQLLEEDLITIEEANALIKFTHFSNPLFIMGTIGSLLLKDQRLGIMILIAHFAGNFIIGLSFKKKSHNPKTKISLKRAINKMNEKRVSNRDNFITILSNAIYETIDVLILLLGIIIIFLILTNLLAKTLNLDENMMILIRGILEMTQGIKFVSNSHFSSLIKTVLITFFLSFGGLSVHLQVASIISDTKIKYKNFLLARIIHSFISAILVFVLYNIIF